MQPDIRVIDDATASNSNVDWMLAVVMLAAGGAVLYAMDWPPVLDIYDRDFNPLVVFVALMAAGAVYYLVRSVRRRAVVSRFGTTVFEQEGHAAYVGEALRGRVKTSRPLSAPEGFTLRLRCIERKGESFDETRRRTRDAILWETTQTVHTGNSQGGIPVEILIPPSALKDARLGLGDWTLKVSAAVDSKPFEATFGLRVYATRDDDDDADDEVEGDTED